MDIPVSKIHLHEDYDSWTINYDICMLSLSWEADLSSEAISTIELPQEFQEYDAGTMCTVTGWGSTGTSDPLPDVMQKVCLYSKTFLL